MWSDYMNRREILRMPGVTVLSMVVVHRRRRYDERVAIEETEKRVWTSPLHLMSASIGRRTLASREIIESQSIKPSREEPSYSSLHSQHGDWSKTGIFRSVFNLSGLFYWETCVTNGYWYKWRVWRFVNGQMALLVIFHGCCFYLSSTTTFTTVTFVNRSD